MLFGVWACDPVPQFCIETFVCEESEPENWQNVTKSPWAQVYALLAILMLASWANTGTTSSQKKIIKTGK